MAPYFNPSYPSFRRRPVSTESFICSSSVKTVIRVLRAKGIPSRTAVTRHIKMLRDARLSSSVTPRSSARRWVQGPVWADDYTLDFLHLRNAAARHLVKWAQTRLSRHLARTSALLFFQISPSARHLALKKLRQIAVKVTEMLQFPYVLLGFWLGHPCKLLTKSFCGCRP